MVYDSKHIHFTLGGRAPEGEIWQTGARYRCTSPLVDPFTSWDEISISDIGVIAALWYADAIMSFPEDISLNWVKLARINEDGSYDGDPKVEDLNPGIAGSDSVSPKFPLQCSNVLSLWSGSNLGVANHGKMYLPCQNFGRTPGYGGFNQAVCADIIALTKDMLMDVQGEISTLLRPFELAIMSNVGAGAHKVPMWIRMGSVTDTQRRRRNALPETYTDLLWA